MILLFCKVPLNADGFIGVLGLSGYNGGARNLQI
jgi:hypothetical protein